MRHHIMLGIIVVLAALLQGCGHKAPLTLPAPDASPAQQGK